MSTTILIVLNACEDPETVKQLSEENIDEFESTMLQIEANAVNTGQVDFILENLDGTMKLSNSKDDAFGECVGYYFNDSSIFYEYYNQTKSLYAEYGLEFEEENEIESTVEESRSDNSRIARSIADYKRPGPDSDGKYGVLEKEGKNVPWPFEKKSTWFYSATTKFNPASYMYPSGVNYGLHLRAKTRLKIDDDRFFAIKETLLNVTEVHCVLKGKKSKKRCWSSHYVTVYRIPNSWLSGTVSFSDSQLNTLPYLGKDEVAHFMKK